MADGRHFKSRKSSYLGNVLISQHGIWHSATYSFYIGLYTTLTVLPNKMTTEMYKLLRKLITLR